MLEFWQRRFQPPHIGQGHGLPKLRFEVVGLPGLLEVWVISAKISVDKMAHSGVTEWAGEDVAGQTCRWKAS